MKKILNKNKLISIIVSVIVLSLFLCGCSGSEKNNINSDTVFFDSQTIKDDEDTLIVPSNKKEEKSAEETEKTKITNESQDNKASTIKENRYKCRFSVRCDAVLNNLDKLDKSKHGLIPKDGIIYEAEEAEFQDGESVFDLLLREMKNNNIHLEFEYTPQFESTYVEGIGNLYEFDCGAMSGWIYKVNGEISSCGCSQYILKNDDYIEWIYMCGMG